MDKTKTFHSKFFSDVPQWVPWFQTVCNTLHANNLLTYPTSFGPTPTTSTTATTLLTTDYLTALATSVSMTTGSTPPTTLSPLQFSKLFSILEGSSMAVVESAPAITIESPPVDPTLVEGPAIEDVAPVKPAKVKATNAPKEKKAVTKKPALHPTYLEMIREAIVSLKERTGSSQYAISKFVDDKHKAHLPANFKKLLLVQLRKLTAAGKLTKLKNSYKIAGKPLTSVKKTSVSAKPKIKSAAATPKSSAVKAKKAAVKPKPKSSVAKPKAKPAAAKLKTAVKSKAVQPKPKTAGRLVKAEKTSAKATPSTKLKKAAPVAAKKLKTVKKVPAVKKA